MGEMAKVRVVCQWESARGWCWCSDSHLSEANG